jgi:hypothetical protein
VAKAACACAWLALDSRCVCGLDEGGEGADGVGVEAVALQPRLQLALRR